MIPSDRPKTNKGKIKRIDLDLFYRFLTVLSETPSIGITKLQMDTGTNSHVCSKYVEFFEKLEIIHI